MTIISPAFKPFFDDRLTVNTSTGLNRTIFGFQVRFDHKDILSFHPGLDRLGRNDQGIGLGGQAQNQVDELTRPQSFSLVGEGAPQADGTGCFIHGIIDESQQAFFGLFFFLGKKGLYFQFSAGRIFFNLRQGLFRQGKSNIDRLNLINDDQIFRVIIGLDLDSLD